MSEASQRPLKVIMGRFFISPGIDDTKHTIYLFGSKLNRHSCARDRNIASSIFIIITRTALNHESHTHTLASHNHQQNIVKQIETDFLQLDDWQVANALPVS